MLNLQFVEGEAEQKSIDRLFGKGNGKHGAGDIIAHDFEIGPSPLLPSETPPPEDPAPRVERVAVPMLSLGSVCTIADLREGGTSEGQTSVEESVGFHDKEAKRKLSLS